VRRTRRRAGEEEVGGHGPRPEALVAVLACRGGPRPSRPSSLHNRRRRRASPPVLADNRTGRRARPCTPSSSPCRTPAAAASQARPGWTVFETPSTPRGPAVRPMKHQRPRSSVDFVNDSVVLLSSPPKAGAGAALLGLCCHRRRPPPVRCHRRCRLFLLGLAGVYSEMNAPLRPIQLAVHTKTAYALRKFNNSCS